MPCSRAATGALMEMEMPTRTTKTTVPGTWRSSGRRRRHLLPGERRSGWQRCTVFPSGTPVGRRPRQQQLLILERVHIARYKTATTRTRPLKTASPRALLFGGGKPRRWELVCSLVPLGRNVSTPATKERIYPERREYITAGKTACTWLGPWGVAAHDGMFTQDCSSRITCQIGHSIIMICWLTITTPELEHEINKPPSPITRILHPHYPSPIKTSPHTASDPAPA